MTNQRRLTADQAPETTLLPLHVEEKKQASLRKTNKFDFT